MSLELDAGGGRTQPRVEVGCRLLDPLVVQCGLQVRQRQNALPHQPGGLVTRHGREVQKPSKQRWKAGLGRGDGSTPVNGQLAQALANGGTEAVTLETVTARAVHELAARVGWHRVDRGGGAPQVGGLLGIAANLGEIREDAQPATEV